MIATTPLPLFQFYLVNAAGESYYIDGNGSLRKSGIPRAVEYSPDGWEDMRIGWERNLPKFGMIRNFSMSMGFVGDGGLILEKLYNRHNPDEKVWLLVQRLELEYTDDDFALTHRFFYKGQIALATYRRQDYKVLVNIMEGGRHEDIRANEGSTYNVPLETDPQRIRVMMDGLELQQNAKYAVAGPASNRFITNLQPMPLGFINSEGTSFGVSFFSQQVENIGPINDYLANSNNYGLFNDSGQAITFRLHGQVKYTCTRNDIGAAVRWDMRQPSDPGNPINFYNSSTAGHVLAPGNTFTINVDQLITVPAGDKVFWLSTFFGLFSPGSIEVAIDYDNSSRLNLSFNSRKPATFCWALRAKDACKRFTGKITPSEEFFVSRLLDEDNELCYTSGDAVRLIPGAFIKSTFKTVTDDIIVRKCAAIGVEGKNIVIERRDHWMATDVVVDLGTVKDLEISPATEVMFNALKVGYNDPKIEDVNGRLAFNNLHSYTVTGLKSVAKVLELICPCPADPFLIEIIRINFDGKATTDANTDNDTIALIVDLDTPFVDADGTYYKLKRDVYATIEGLPNPDSAFNIRSSTPRRIFNEWESYLHACLTGYEAQTIQHDSASKNELLYTVGPDGSFRENESRNIGLLADPMFARDKATFTATYPRSLFKVLNDTPRALFAWTDARTGVRMKGWPLKAAQQCKTNQEQQFVMILHKDNDLKLLENG